MAPAPRENLVHLEVRGSSLIDSGWGAATEELTPDAETAAIAPKGGFEEIDPLFLFACYVEWERREDSGGAWELITAVQGSDSDARAHALALLGASQHFGVGGWDPARSMKMPISKNTITLRRKT